MTETNKHIAHMTCVITGASSGIGKETAVALARQGATVVIICRDPERGELAAAEVRAKSGNPAVELLLADLSSQRAVRRVAAEFLERHAALHILINNAARIYPTRTETAEGIEATLATNHLAPFLLTSLLREVLVASAPARVVNVASAAHRYVRAITWDDLQAKEAYGAMRIYYQTKLMNVLFTYELARRLTGTGVTVNCLHPGWPLRTGLGSDVRGLTGVILGITRLFGASAKRASSMAIYLATAEDVTEVSGKYFVNGRAVRSSTLSYDDGAAKRLWEVSADLCRRS